MLIYPVTQHRRTLGSDRLQENFGWLPLPIVHITSRAIAGGVSNFGWSLLPIVHTTLRAIWWLPLTASVAHHFASDWGVPYFGWVIPTYIVCPTRCKAAQHTGRILCGTREVNANSHCSTTKILVGNKNKRVKRSLNKWSLKKYWRYNLITF